MAVINLDPEQRQALADAVKRRIAELRQRTDAEISQLGGPSNTTMTGIRHGTRDALATTTLERLDDGMDWERGSAYRLVVEGAEPVKLDKLGGAARQVLRAAPLNGGRGAVGRLLQIRDEIDEVIKLISSDEPAG